MTFLNSINEMSHPIDLLAHDPTLKKLKFKVYRYKQEKQAVQFLPTDQEPQNIIVRTPWGADLSAEKGAYIVNDIDDPDNRWPVQQEIFEATYVGVRPGIYIKRATVLLYPLKDFTKDVEQLVRVHTLEGVITVRAGDFFLAQGVKGEIWPMPNDRVDVSLEPM